MPEYRRSIEEGSPEHFDGDVEIVYLDHPDAGHEDAPSNIDPSEFTEVDPLDATYIGIRLVSHDGEFGELGVPEIFYGIRMQGQPSFIAEQADEIVRNFLMQVAPYNEIVALMGLTSSAEMHRYIEELDGIHRTDRGGPHPNISPENIPLFKELASAMDAVSSELSTNGHNAAQQVWSRELAAIRSRRSLEMSDRQNPPFLG